MFQTIEKRAKKRALFLLEKMDRTEQQLRRKLKENGYPDEIVTRALDYVKQYHYIDDARYAKQYISYHKEKDSRQKILYDLLQKGVKKELIVSLLEEEGEWSQREQIMRWLEKKNYAGHCTQEKEKRKIYQFLLRKGYSGSEILSAMNAFERENDGE
jgi:regulatory protein